MFVIAGVSGHVGSIAAKDLLSKGKPVKVIVRDATKGAAWSKQGAEVAVGSLDDQAFLTSALKGAQALFTLLPPPEYSAPDFYAAQRKRADGIAAAVKASGVPYVVMLSSIGADLAEGTGPIKGLHYLENALRGTGTKLAALRAGAFQENVGQSLGAAKQAGIFPNFMGSPDYAFPMIATKDIGTLAAELLLVSPPKNETVDLQGPSYSTNQVAEKLGAALGKKLQRVDIPPAGHVDALVKAGVPKPFADAYAEMYAGFGSGKIATKGDRLVQGKTTLDDTIKTLTQ